MIHQSNPADVAPHLRRLADTCAQLASQIRERIDRSDRTVAYANFCSYAASELRRASTFYPEDLAGLAWAARNLFELYLIVRSVIQSDENFRAWLGQRIGDEKDFIEGVLMYVQAGECAPQVATLKARRDRLLELSKRHDIPSAKPFRIQALAKALGEEDEYVALFKLFSKYVHPSSLLINAYSLSPPDPTYLKIFHIKAQMYAGQTIKLIKDAVAG
jgi:hypothetical protein